VFPNFVTNKATMTCSGLLPIDELRDWRSPGSVVCQRIKRNVLEIQ
jgi:large subunit GTPase 1